ncbi:MAG: tandem-95 repeat protein [Candidatus Marinimicrobia bacterium]|nr:tandem-95 repeat protein [Candidatus Neomarinimicrobiota bacterium]
MNSRFKNSILFRLLIVSFSAISVLIAEEWTIHESFENNNFNGIPDVLSWAQGGDANWSIDTQASDGTYSARSGVITHNQTSSISTSAEIPYLPGSIKFSYKLESEDVYDYLKFYVNGSIRGQWSGVQDWADTTFALTPGNYEFKWEYAKYSDPGTCGGGQLSDCSGDGDCCTAGWATDNTPDCLEQQYGCDLTCYESDGGTCSSASSSIDAVWIDNISIIGHNIVVNAGTDFSQDFPHDGSPGGEVQFDGTSTYPDENANLSIPALAVWFQNQMKWYSIDDMDNLLATGPNPTVSLDCAMSNDITNMCVGEHDIVLKIAFGSFSEMDTVHVSITEPNQPPTLTAISVLDTVSIANNNGIPGNSTSVNLMSQFFDQVEFSDPDILSDGSEEQLSLTWSDMEGNSLSPLQNVTAGDYTYQLKATDPYGSFDNLNLTLTMIEVNEIPAVTIAAINDSEIGINQNSIENQSVMLYGFVEDDDNDLNGSTSTTEDDVNYLWLCTQNGNPITVTSETSINASFSAPTVDTNLATETVACLLQVTDPFQVIDGTNSTSEPINITVYNDNQPPIINVSSTVKPSLNEGGTLEITLSELISNNFISITDVDNDLDFTIEIDSGDNYSLDNSTITPDSEFYGEISLPIRVNDGFIYAGDLYNNLSETAYLIVDVIGVNDPPILIGPDNSATEEGTDIGITGVSVSDADIDGIINDDRLQYNFSAENGTISLSNTLGLIFEDGCNCDGTSDATLSFTANPQNFNNSVSVLTFHPSPDYFGPDGEISISVNDEGNIGIPDGTDPTELTDSHTISISVNAINDPPIFTIPATTTVDEDAQVLVTGFSVEDVDIADYSMEVELSVENGVMTLSETENITFDYGDGFEDEQMSFSGTKTAVNNLLNSITFIPNEHFNGDVVLSAEVNDLGAYGSGGSQTDSQTFMITVNPINDSPEGVDDSFSLAEGTELTDNVLQNDIDLDEVNGSSPSSHYSLTINTTPIENVQHGSLSLTSEGVFTYQPFENYNGDDSFTYELIDGEGLTAQATVSILTQPINNAPELNFPSARTTYEDTEIVILGISVSDEDIADSDMEIQLSVDNGLITLGSTEGLTFSLGDGNSDATLIFSGLITDVSNAISPLTFIPNEHFNGDVQLLVEANDLGGTGSGGPLSVNGNLSITVNAVNDDPVAVEDIGTTDEDTMLTENVLTNDSDLDSSNGSSPDNHYALTVNNIPITNVQNGILTLASDGAYTYTPNDDFFGTDSFVYELSDGAGGTAQATVNITVNGVNDAPNLTIPTNKYTEEDTPISISGIMFSDIDIADSEMKMDINVVNSFISLAGLDGLTFISGDGENDSQLSFTGTMTDILNATTTITFTPEENYNGEVTVEISISDIGGNGSGGILIDSGEFIVTISGVNDAPEISSPGAQSDDEDNEFSIYGLSVSDVDAIETTNEVQVTISAESGQLSLYTISDLTFVLGDGTLDSEMTFSGVISDINTALNGFSFLGNSHYNGEDTITVQLSDLGNTGTGDILQHEVKMGVYLNAINDPPVNQLNNGEDAPPQISVVGTEITASPGSWNDKIDTDISLTAANITFSYQWQRNSINCTDGTYVNDCNDDDGNFTAGNSCGDSGQCELLAENWIDIIEENAETYEIKNIDAQKYIRIEVTATDDGVGLPSQQSTIAFSDFHYVNNSAPIPQNIGYNIYEDNVLTEDAPGILVNDLDPDDDAISAEIVTYPQNGEVNLNLNGSFVYTPNENFNGVDQFEYKIYDGALYGNENALVSITVSPVNDIPIYTSGGNVETSENLGTVEMFGWAGDISDGDPEITQALEFTLTALNPDLFEAQPTVDPVSGTLSFAAFDNLNGNSDVTIFLKDNGGLDNEGVDETELSQFNINIIPINDSPSFTAGDTITVLEDSGEYTQFSWATNIDDGDAELVQELSFSIVSNDNSLLFSQLPAVDNSGKITFVLADNKSGVAEVVIALIDDGSSISPNSNTSPEITLIINVTPVNDIPQWSVGEGIEILEDAGSQSISNYITEIDDGDPEVTQILTFNLIDVTNAALFAETPSIDATGTLTYLINENINGSSLVYFTLSDDGGTDNGGVNQTSQQFFEIEVLPVNDAPAFGISELGELAEDDFSVAEIIVTPEIPPNDEGNQSVQYSLSNLEAINENGALFANLSIESATGNVTINPVENGNGEAVFTIIANDGSGTEYDGVEIFEQIFTYKVNAINDPPINIELPSIGGNAYIDSLLSISDGVWSDDLDTLFSGISEITYEYRWQRADDTDGTNIEYISDAVFNEYWVTQEDFHKFLRVKVIASDNGPRDDHEGLFTTEYSEFLEILNTPPVAVDDSYSVNEDLTLTVDFELGLLKGWNPGDECVRFGNDYDSDCDRDGDSLTVSIASDVSFGALEPNTNGSFTYIPDTNKNEINMNITDDILIDQFTYTISDGESSSTPASVSIVINPVNDAPIFELTNLSNEVITAVEVYEDFATQHVLVSPGLIPVDETGQTVEYLLSPESITSADISINSVTGEVTIQSIANLYETVQFTVTATDDGGTELEGVNEYSQSFVLDITSVNDVPSFLKGDDQSILEDDGEISISWATDISRGPIDEVSQGLSFLVTTDNDAFFKDSQIPTIDGITGNLTYQIADDLNGEVEVSLTLKDDGGTDYDGVDESEPQTFNISVQAVNDAPSFSLGENIELEINEDGFENDNGLNKSVSGWTTDIIKGPADEVEDVLTFNITSSKSDSTIFSTFPQINGESGKIEYSINPNYNGLAEFTVNLSDDGGVEYGGADTSADTTFSVWVHQVNDIPIEFEIHPRIYEYAKDTSTFYFDVDANSDTTGIFYRLPYQVFAPPVQPDSLLRFSWERNDSLDVDTYATWNFDSLFRLYYRLEATPSDNSKTFVLSDDMDSRFFVDVDSVSVEVDMTAEFPVYTGLFDSDSLYSTEHLDTTGVTQYSWKVVAQNYSKDRLNKDPERLELSNVDWKIDLELPSAEMAFFQSELYAEYYDLYFVTNEETIDSDARVWIDFDAYTQNLFPSKMGDSLYHISSTFVNTGTVKYNFQVRDKRLNLGRSLDTVKYEILIPELARIVASPDNILEMYVPENSVQFDTPVIISASDLNEELSKNKVDIVSREYQITANSMVLLKPAILSFTLLEVFNDEPLYKYQIVKINDDNIEELSTQFDGESFVASILSAGNYAVVYNADAVEPLPEKFALGNIYPNPFNPSTTIEFAIPDENNVIIDIYNLRGQHVLNLMDGNINPGYHSVVWSGIDKSGGMVSSGIYFVQIKFANQTTSKKVTFLK